MVVSVGVSEMVVGLKKRRRICVCTYLRVNDQKGHWKVTYHTVGRSPSGTGMEKGGQWWLQFCSL